eukprot:scaffold9813_cov99-Isochrysis_galbana.AAC.5
MRRGRAVCRGVGVSKHKVVRFEAFAVNNRLANRGRTHMSHDRRFAPPFPSPHPDSPKAGGSSGAHGDPSRRAAPALEAQPHLGTGTARLFLFSGGRRATGGRPPFISGRPRSRERGDCRRTAVMLGRGSLGRRRARARIVTD